MSVPVGGSCPLIRRDEKSASALEKNVRSLVKSMCCRRGQMGVKPRAFDRFVHIDRISFRR